MLALTAKARHSPLGDHSLWGAHRTTHGQLPQEEKIQGAQGQKNMKIREHASKSKLAKYIYQPH